MGMTNSSTKLALKRIITSNKPNFLFVAEPWMSLDMFSLYWFLKLGLKLIVVNKMPNKMPNIWCFCKSSINPIIIYVGDEAIAFTIMIDNKVFGLVAIYASINCIIRRNMWIDLSNIPNNHKVL